VLKCHECGCVTEAAHGWYASILEEPESDDSRVVAPYCPPCATRLLGADPRLPRYL